MENDATHEALQALADDFAIAQRSTRAQLGHGKCERIFPVCPIPDEHGCYKALGTVEPGIVHPATGTWCAKDAQFHWGNEGHDCPPTWADHVYAVTKRWLEIDPTAPRFYALIYFCDRRADAADAAARAAAHAAAHAADAAAHAADAAADAAHAADAAADAADAAHAADAARAADAGEITAILAFLHQLDEEGER